MPDDIAERLAAIEQRLTTIEAHLNVPKAAQRETNTTSVITEHTYHRVYTAPASPHALDGIGFTRSSKP